MPIECMTIATLYEACVDLTENDRFRVAFEDGSTKLYKSYSEMPYSVKHSAVRKFNILQLANPNVLLCNIYL